MKKKISYQNIGNLELHKWCVCVCVCVRERETLIIVAVIIMTTRPLTLAGNKYHKLSKESMLHFTKLF